MRSGRAVAQPFHAFRVEPIDPFGHDLGRYIELARGRSLAQAAFGYTAHHRLSTFGRQRRILVAVHLVSPWNTEASQPQLPRFRPDGQPPERPHLAAARTRISGAVSKGTIMLGRAAKTYRFGEFTLDLSRGRLEGARGPIELRPKSFEVLRYFVEHPDRLISKDELLDVVWANVHGTEDSLTRCISEIRAALADADQKIIRNLPRRGYILATPVTEADRVDRIQPVPVEEQPRRVLVSDARSAWLPSLTR